MTMSSVEIKQEPGLDKPDGAIGEDVVTVLPTSFEEDPPFKSNDIQAGFSSPPNKSQFKKNSKYCGTGRLPCPDLGEGWSFEQIVRQQGKSAGDFDTYYYSPKGKRLRSKLQLQSFCNVKMDEFDYNSGRKWSKEELANSAKRKSKKDALLIDKLINFDKDMWKKEKSTPKKRTPPKIKTARMDKSLRAPFQSITENQSLKIKTPVKKKEKKVSPKLTHKPKLSEIKIKTAGSPAELFYLKARSSGELLAKVTELSQEDLTALLHKAWESLNQSAKQEFIDAFHNKDGNTDVAISDKPKPIVLQQTSFHADHCPCVACARLHSPTGRYKRVRCRSCENCLRSNCGRCSNCKAMKQFGGNGSKKQSCELRKCLNMETRLTSSDELSPPTMIYNNPAHGNQVVMGNYGQVNGRKRSSSTDESFTGNKLQRLTNPIVGNVASMQPLLKNPQISTTPAQAIYIVSQNSVSQQNFSNVHVGLNIPVVTRPMQPCFHQPNNFQQAKINQPRPNLILPHHQMPNLQSIHAANQHVSIMQTNPTYKPINGGYQYPVLQKGPPNVCVGQTASNGVLFHSQQPPNILQKFSQKVQNGEHSTNEMLKPNSVDKIANSICKRIHQNNGSSLFSNQVQESNSNDSSKRRRKSRNPKMYIRSPDREINTQFSESSTCNTNT